jgi:hypothetical protein
MKRLVVILPAVAVLATTASASLRQPAVPASPSNVGHSTSAEVLPPATPAGQTTLWGHIKSLTRKGGHFELRFDPALFLHGVTANRAAAEDRREVANDYYVVDETHRQFTYVVLTTARVTVLTRGLRSARITVSELAQIVKGKNPKHRPLFDRANGLGYWIRVGDKYPNPALSLDQQYQP